jgi:hypothetical protein
VALFTCERRRCSVLLPLGAALESARQFDSGALHLYLEAGQI